MNLNEVRIQLIEIENNLLELFEKRNNLAIKVAESKYPNIKDKINEDNILELIENKIVEKKIFDRIKIKCKDQKLQEIVIKLYEEYLIPKNKEIQVEYIKNKHFK